MQPISPQRLFIAEDVDSTFIREEVFLSVILYNNFRFAKMEKTVMMSCVFLFISSLLLVDAMVRVPHVKRKVFHSMNVLASQVPGLYLFQSCQILWGVKLCTRVLSFFVGFNSLFCRDVTVMTTLKTCQDLSGPTLRNKWWRWQYKSIRLSLLLTKRWYSTIYLLFY